MWLVWLIWKCGSMWLAVCDVMQVNQMSPLFVSACDTSTTSLVSLSTFNPHPFYSVFLGLIFWRGISKEMNILRPSMSQYSSALTYYIGQREKLCRALLWRDPRLNSQITIRIAGCEVSSVHIFPTSEYFWKFSQKWCNLVEMWNVMIHN